MQNHLNLCQSVPFNSSSSQISSLIQKISQITSAMNHTFQQSILKHQEQFIKAYKIKIYQLTKLFYQLRKNIEDKFINNAITQKMQTMIKQRDYFKYECLKLNNQYKNVIEDYKNITEQMVNVTQQMNIYKHLLQNQKIKSSEIEKNAKKLKHTFKELASKTVQDANLMEKSKKSSSSTQKEKNQITKLNKQLKEKSQTIMALKARIEELDEFSQKKESLKDQKRQLQEIFRFCVQNWKREIISKSRKIASRKYSSQNLIYPEYSKHCSAEQFSSMQKKQLLQMLFTHPQFLEFLEKVLFDSKFQIQFIEVPDCSQGKRDEVLVKNRSKLYELMRKKGLMSSLVSRPVKFR